MTNEINVIKASGDKLMFVLVCLFTATLSTPHQINLVFLISLLVTAIYFFGFSIFANEIKKDALLILLLCYTGLNIITAIRDYSISTFFSAIERRAPLVILPVLFTTIMMTRDRTVTLFKWFVVSVVVAELASLVCFFLNIDLNGLSSSDFSYLSWELSENTIIPSNYLAVYASFATVILVDQFRSSAVFSQLVSSIFIIFIVSFIIILGSRMGLIATFIIIFGRIFYQAFYMNRKVKFFHLLVIIVIAISAAGVVPYLKNKFSSLVSANEPRYYEFQAAFNVLSRNPWTGYGFKGAEEELVKEYQRMGFHDGVTNRFNAHNEFLQIGLSMGLPGVIILALIFYVCTLRAIQLKEFLPLAFICIFFIASLTEVLLVRNKGIIFFAYFIGLFFLSSSKTSSKD